jgi:L-glyceraldehyde 3-phosphate reductase
VSFAPDPERYENMQYRRTGRSGLMLPRVSLGLWHNFGGVDTFENARAMLCRAFDLGITHFDLANNYGPPPGSAEVTMGKLLREDLAGHRDELVISTKAGYRMWDGPYGDHGSRKYLLASLDQSLERLGLDYVDIFYHHRPDPETPLEETMGALAHAVKSGKALYVGVSNYDAALTRRAQSLLSAMGTPAIIHQPSYSMFNRWVEAELLDELHTQGMGCIAFSPLAQGVLTNRYVDGVPEDSRAKRPSGFLQESEVTEVKLQRVRALDALAKRRGQTLAQLALSWVLRQPVMTSVLIGASRVSQIEDSVGALKASELDADTLKEIERILSR